MKIDAMLIEPPRGVAARAAVLEGEGYDGAWTAETNHDPFLPIVAAAARTSTIGLGTSIAVAFARNPMNLAQLGWDLQAYTGGRLTLGLGSQVKAHIERRFSMPWSAPAARMRETVLAIRAIWASWADSTPLHFEGRFFTHTLMTPPVRPDAADLDGLGLPPILLAGVGPLMTTVAGEVADGFIFHAFSTSGYLEAVTIPRLLAARRSQDKGFDGFQVTGPVLVATGATRAEEDEAVEAVKKHIAFYGSTPAYSTVLEFHGWDALHSRLHALSREGEWEAMGRLIDDDVLHAFAVVGEPDQIAGMVHKRFGGKVDRVSLSTPYPIDAEIPRSIVADFRRG